MWPWKKKQDGAWDDNQTPPADRKEATQYDLVESLQQVAEAASLQPDELFLSILFAPGDDAHKGNRSEIILGDGRRLTQWQVESLRPLFRGDRQPPTDSEMGQYPELYVPFFHRVEYNVYRYCRTMGLEPTDDQFLDLYSQLRRRPDGKSLGPLHDVIWQSAALMLGLMPWSEAEYTAVFGQLARSARHFKVRYSSRNYMAYVRQNSGKEAPKGLL